MTSVIELCDDSQTKNLWAPWLVLQRWEGIFYAFVFYGEPAIE